MTTAAPPSGRWLFGPGSDLLLGCGLLYGLVFVALSVGGDSPDAARPAFLMPALFVALSMPHYEATLLRVYEQRADRRRYVAFSLYASLLVLAAFVVGLYDTLVGSLLLTVYLTWSPWHYTGQNYGLAVMFLRRRGVGITPRTKRLLYASFVLSYALVFVAFHSTRGSGAVQYGGAGYDGSALRFLPLGMPAALTDLLFPLLGVAYLASLLASAALL